MASTQPVTVPERKPTETTSEPRPTPAPADKPFTIKIQTGIPF